MYDNEKLEAAVTAWLESRCEVGFGQVYSVELYTDFEAFLRETKALQASPGITAFGRTLTTKGFGRKRVNGLQYVTGLELKAPVQVDPQRRAASIERGQEAEAERKKARRSIVASVSRKKNTTLQESEVDKRMRMESKERIAAAGLSTGDCEE